MKNKLLPFSVALFSLGAYAQVGIGVEVNSINASAQLEVKADDKGVLIPQVELKSLNIYSPITGQPTDGLLVYNKGNVEKKGFYYWLNNKWNKMYADGDVGFTETITELRFDAATGKLYYKSETGVEQEVAGFVLPKQWALQDGNNTKVAFANGVYKVNVEKASSDVAGVIKIGEGLKVSPDGKASVVPASAGVIGGVKVGETVEVAADGKLEVKRGTLYSTDLNVKVANEALAQDAENTILRNTFVSIKNNAIKTNHIANGAVQHEDILDGAVYGNKIPDSAIISEKIGVGEVKEKNIGENQVTTGKIKDENVTTEKLANASVTSSKLATNSVSTNNIVDRSIQLVDIKKDAPNKMLTTNASGEPQWEQKYTLTLEDGLVFKNLPQVSGSYAVTADNAVLQQLNIGLKPGEKNTVMTTDNTGNIVWAALADRNKERFYMPHIVFPVKKQDTEQNNPYTEFIQYNDSSKVFTVKLYEIYKQQFGMTDNTTSVKSANAGNLSVYDSDQLGYFITYYDKNVYTEVSVTDEGVLTYKIKDDNTNPSVTPWTYMTIVFKVK